MRSMGDDDAKLFVRRQREGGLRVVRRRGFDCHSHGCAGQEAGAHQTCWTALLTAEREMRGSMHARETRELDRSGWQM